MWNFDELRRFLPEDTIREIIPIPIDSKNVMENRRVWTGSPEGIFMVKSAYGICYREDKGNVKTWDPMRRMDTLPKVKIFLWQLTYGKILINDHRAQRNLTYDPSCCICKHPKKNCNMSLGTSLLLRRYWKASLSILIPFERIAWSSRIG